MNKEIINFRDVKTKALLSKNVKSTNKKVNLLLKSLKTTYAASSMVSLSLLHSFCHLANLTHQPVSCTLVLNLCTFIQRLFTCGPLTLLNIAHQILF